METTDGYIDIPSGKIASVITHLQMFRRPPSREERSEASWSLSKLDFVDMEHYRMLFRRVGEDWLWSSRLQMNEGKLSAVLAEPLYEAYVFYAQGHQEGLAELDFRSVGECELSFFGLTPELVGQGAGRWMMNRVLGLAWSRPIQRLWVHTCSLDHPGALAFYIRSGFVPFRRQIHIDDDPRLAGLLRRDSAPQTPLI